jgi:hypothetical protein
VITIEEAINQKAKPESVNEIDPVMQQYMQMVMEQRRRNQQNDDENVIYFNCCI